MPRRRRIGFVLLATFLLLLVPPGQALADWDLEAYLGVVTQAEAEFDSGNYAAAVARYRTALGLLQDALSAGSIPPDAREQALVEQKLLDYKLAVAQQRNGDCDEAYTNFERQADAGDAPDVIRAALPVRLAETGACRVSDALAGGDVAGAGATLTEVETDLETHPLSASADASLQAEDRAARATLDGQRQALADRLAGDAIVAAQSGRCAEASDLLDQSQRRVAEGAALDDARSAIDANCGLTYHDWAPWVVVGVGGVLFIAGVATEVGFASDADDFEVRRGLCLDGDKAACDDALELADELEPRQPVPATLMITGVLAMGAGVTWWLLTHTFDIRATETDAVSLEPMIDPRHGSAGMGVRWTFDL